MRLKQKLYPHCRLSQNLDLDRPLAQPQKAPTAIRKAWLCRPATEAGISPRRATYFLARQKVSKEHGPTVRVPALRYGKTCVTLPGLRCRPTRGALAALCSDRRRQVRARCNAVLRQQCPQPQHRAAGADKRAGADGLRELRRNRPLALIQIAGAAIKNISKLSGSRTRIWSCPLCPRLRRQVLGAGSCTAECNCIVITSTATCLNGERSSK